MTYFDCAGTREYNQKADEAMKTVSRQLQSSHVDPTVRKRTMKDLAKEALAVQDSCNLSGVVHSFSRAMTELREILRERGVTNTDEINTHYIAILFSNKIASLTGSESARSFANAYEWAKEETMY